MILNEATHFLSILNALVCLKLPPVSKHLSISKHALHVHVKYYLDDIQIIFLFPKIYTLIAFYQRIVELWCYATYFWNAPRAKKKIIFSTTVDTSKYCWTEVHEHARNVIISDHASVLKTPVKRNLKQKGIIILPFHTSVAGFTSFRFD